MRREWGYGLSEQLNPKQLIREAYQGIRPAPGYPAQPDHSEKPALFKLLRAEERIGVSLTENFSMSPASSVCGLYFSHPESCYFGVGKSDGTRLRIMADVRASAMKKPNACWDRYLAMKPKQNQILFPLSARRSNESR